MKEEKKQRNEDRKVVIKVSGLKKKLGERQILDGIDFEVYQGETFVVIGGSGSGKSTLLRHLTGAITPDEGTVHILGKDISTLDEDEMDGIRRRIGMSFQNAALFDSMTVSENVKLPIKEHIKLDDKVIDIMVRMKLELVGLSGFEDLMPSQLSGGMKKRVGIARAFGLDPEIIFYDEPTAGLDPVGTAIIDKLISDLSNVLMVTSIVITHDMNSVFRIADRIAMLHEGRILQIGSCKEIRKSTNPIIRQFVKGDPDGPIRFHRHREEYLEHMTG